MHEVVYQENRMCPIILGHIYIVKLSDYNGFTWWRNTPIGDFTGWRNMCMKWYIKKIGSVQSF